VIDTAKEKGSVVAPISVVICHRSWRGAPVPELGIFILRRARKNYKCTYPDCNNEIKKGDLYYTEITPKSVITPRYCVTCGNNNKKFAALSEEKTSK